MQTATEIVDGEWKKRRLGKGRPEARFGRIGALNCITLFFGDEQTETVGSSEWSAAGEHVERLFPFLPGKFADEYFALR